MRKTITFLSILVTMAAYIGSCIAAIIHINICKPVLVYWSEIYDYGESAADAITIICMAGLEAMIYVSYTVLVLSFMMRCNLLPCADNKSYVNILKAIVNVLIGCCVYYIGVAVFGILRIALVLLAALIWLICNMISTMICLPFNLI